MSKNITIGIVLCCLLVIVVLLEILGNNHGLNKNTSGVKNTALPKETMVLLTNTGFQPKSVTITKGGAVRWINKNASADASVNSDTYPTNRLYPQLNLGKFSKGSSLAHIFTTTGTYTYHNQFNPTETGTVIVK